MARNNHDAYKMKISPEFATRLARLKPQQKIRAMVMVRVDGSEETPQYNANRTPSGRQ
jgi:hypothetical protein